MQAGNVQNEPPRLLESQNRLALERRLGKKPTKKISYIVEGTPEFNKPRK